MGDQLSKTNLERSKLKEHGSETLCLGLRQLNKLLKMLIEQNIVFNYFEWNPVKTQIIILLENIKIYTNFQTERREERCNTGAKNKHD